MAATRIQKTELRDKVSKLVTDKFGGDYHKAFAHYADDIKDGKIGRHALAELLGDAGIGNWLTRAAWASGIIVELDTDKDGGISESAFEDVLK